MDTIQKREDYFFKYSQLKCYFKQRKFEDICSFIKLNIGSADISLNIIDKESYREFIKSFYFQFVSKDVLEFDNVYKNKFELCF